MDKHTAKLMTVYTAGTVLVDTLLLSNDLLSVTMYIIIINMLCTFSNIHIMYIVSIYSYMQCFIKSSRGFMHVYMYKWR